MPFTHRVSFAGALYHITTRGNDQQRVFFDERDYEAFRSILRRYRDKHEFKLYAYAMMSNHVHLLMEPTPTASISEIMHDVNLSYAKYFNARYDRSGHVWGDRFHSTIIDSETYFLEAMRYMDLNPVRAQVVPHPKEYDWSSYRCCAEGHRDDLIEPHELYVDLGDTQAERQQVYREFVEARVEEGIGERPLDFGNTNFLGGEDFEGRMVEVYGQQIWPKYRRLLQRMRDIRRGALAQQ